MGEQDQHDRLVNASRLLAECEFLLRWFPEEQKVADLLFGARRCCDEMEERTRAGDAETAATIGILRAIAATFALRQTALVKVASDFDDDDGTAFNGIEDDQEGVSRPLAEQAVQTARAALHADPDDPLVPLYLGHALTWCGDRGGAVAAYEEALRRDPWDRCARSSLKRLGSVPAVLRSPNEMSHGRHGFALIRGAFWISNNDWTLEHLLFGSAADARVHVDQNIGNDHYLIMEDLEDEEAELVLQIHCPGRRVTEYDLNDRIQEDPDDSPRIDWSGIPLDEPLESPLPPGRPLRISGNTCFFTDVV